MILYVNFCTQFYFDIVGSGELKSQSNGMLPNDPSSKEACRNRGGCYIAGDIRSNENMALTVMHTIWMRQHNKIAQELKRLNSDWTETALFETTRKIVGAIFQHIVYTEYVPQLATLSPYRGYRVSEDASIANVFATAAFRYGHSLIQNSFAQLDKNFNKVAPDVPLQNLFFNSAIIRKKGIEETAYGMVGNHSQDVNTNFAYGIARKLFIPPGSPRMADLAAMNIQRGRDHGIPTYGYWRRACGFRRLRRWSDLRRVMFASAIGPLKTLYKHPTHIDMFVAGVAEIPLTGYEVGPTFHCIIRDQFERLRDGDRFFYRNRGVFTQDQLRQIQRMSMAKVLCETLKGAVSMQRAVLKAFKPGTRRPVCNSLPGINLSYWRGQ